MKILVTGGSGFIGKNIIEQLGSRYNFFYPAHSELDLENTDRVYDYLKNNNFDLIIHTANIGGNRKTIGLENVVGRNLRMYFNLIKAKEFYKRIIFLGSGAEYDKKFDIKKIKETDFDKSIPTDEYGFYKYISSKFAEKTNYITHLRLFGVYGKHEDYQIRFISEAICRALLGLPIIIKQNVFFDYLYIDDFVKILDYFIRNNPKHNFYNVGRGQEVDLNTVAKRILCLTGANVGIFIEKEGLNNEYTCNIDRLKSEIQGISFTGFDDSLREMILYYKSILSKIDLNIV